jgi:NAD(P)-dependent dehydrogenase (short-subunit alcohol dehydrogenase family)
MVTRRRGGIINVASTSGFQPIPTMAVYAASKAFVLSFTQALWAETKASGVRVMALCPGPTETRFFETANPAKQFLTRWPPVARIRGRVRSTEVRHRPRPHRDPRSWQSPHRQRISRYAPGSDAIRGRTLHARRLRRARHGRASFFRRKDKNAAVADLVEAARTAWTTGSLSPAATHDSWLIPANPWPHWAPSRWSPIR